MKKTLIFTALLTLLSTAHADPVAQPVKPVDLQPAAQQAPAVPAVIDCKYHLSAQTTHIEESILSTWVSKATVQSFNFNPTFIDQELADLKLCYTDSGWLGFNDALQKSGNINAIKAQHLTVSSQIDGSIKILPVKENQWKATVPLQVVYQNDKQKLTQLLDLDVLIGRKISGDLGIMQMIATPRPAPPALKVSEQPAAAAQTAAPTVPQPAHAPTFQAPH